MMYSLYRRRVAAAVSGALLTLTLLAGCRTAPVSTGPASEPAILSSTSVATTTSAAATSSATARGSSTTKTTTTATTRTTAAPAPISYQKIYESLKPLVENMKKGDLVFGAGPEATAGGATTKASSKTTVKKNAVLNDGAESAGSHSDTNVQVQGVQEADIVKTDGRYIYTLSTEELVITLANSGQPKVVSRIPLNAERKVDDAVIGGIAKEFYVTDNRLVLIRECFETVKSTAKTDGGATSGHYVHRRYRDTEAVIYDISDPAKPKLLQQLGQSGAYLSSRMVGEYLYIATNHYIYGNVQSGQPETYVPTLIQGGHSRPVPADTIRIPDKPSSIQYLVLTGTDVTRPDKHVSSQSVLDGGSNLYASGKSMYVADTRFVDITGGTQAVTRLLSFSMDKGAVKQTASGQVEGAILNQFSMDENSGYFRIVTTSNRWQRYKEDGSPLAGFQSKTGTNLYVLNGALKTVGKIENLAPGEQVYSVRFDGDMGYFVTFRQVDPLFTVDLKNPAAPKVLGKLKIPGFSQYLHMWSDTLLFGLGMDADENTGRTGGMKLSMFDVTDPQQVTEKYKTLLGSAYLYSEASYNHKAIVVEPAKNLLAFPVYSQQGKQSYMVYRFDKEEGFVRRGELKPEDTMDGSWLRGLYIGEYLYTVTPHAVTAYRLSDLGKAGSAALT